MPVSDVVKGGGVPAQHGMKAGRCFLAAVAVLTLFSTARAAGLLEGPARYVWVQMGILVVVLALVAWTSGATRADLGLGRTDAGAGLRYGAGAVGIVLLHLRAAGVAVGGELPEQRVEIGRPGEQYAAGEVGHAVFAGKGGLAAERSQAFPGDEQPGALALRQLGPGAVDRVEQRTAGFAGLRLVDQVGDPRRQVGVLARYEGPAESLRRALPDPAIEQLRGFPGSGDGNGPSAAATGGGASTAPGGWPVLPGSAASPPTTSACSPGDEPTGDPGMSRGTAITLSGGKSHRYSPPARRMSWRRPDHQTLTAPVPHPVRGELRHQ
jgi:hypothetical protein